MSRKSLLAALALSTALTPAFAGLPIGPSGNGGSGGGGGGGVSPLVTTCPATSTSSGTATVQNGIPSVAKSSAYSVLPADCGGLLEVTGGAPLTLPPFTGTNAVGSGFNIGVMNAGTVPVVVTASSGNINANGTSSSSATVAPGQTMAIIVNAATNGWDASSSSGGGASLNGPGYMANLWYLPVGETSRTASAGPAALFANCAAAWIGNIAASGGGSGSIGGIALAASAAGTTTVQTALYADDATGSTHRPGAFLGSSNQVSTTSGQPATIYSPGVSISANALYWVCVQAGDTTFKYTGAGSTATAQTSYLWYVGTALITLAGQGGSVPNSGITTTTGITAYGTWPATFHGATFVELNSGNVAPWFAFLFSSVP